MNKGIVTRIIIGVILKKIRETSINLDSCFEKNIENNKLSKLDRSFIYNVTITTIRNINVIEQILENFVTKINKKEINYFLIISALCQIFYLKLKSYAVINSTCEALKELGSRKSISFVNGLLRNIDRKKTNINLNNLKKSKHPIWFKNNIKNLSSNKRKAIYKSVTKKPCLHICFKSKKSIKLINKKYIKTSETSIALKQNVQIKDLPGYGEGNWWIQDYASTIPVRLLGNIVNKKILDMCAAPGGKTFQLINMGAKVTAYDISKKRINLTKVNVKRLNYNLKIIENNILKISEQIKYDVVLLDPPCSSTGTIKRNPEILYRLKKPNINYFIELQYKMLIKASNLLKKSGILIYSVCSIFQNEGIDQIQKFLLEKNNFSISKIKVDKSCNYKKLITNEGCFQSYPYDLYNLGGIDGFFIAKLIKEK